MFECECEHIAHFDKTYKTPNGNPGHNYCVQYHDLFKVEAKTEHGIFNICKDCAKDCLDRKYR